MTSWRRPRRSAIVELTDRDLVRLYWPVELRPAFDALFAIDDAFAEVLASSTQPALGAIRLAWWRDALERLDAGPPPPEPRLQAVAAELLPRGISGKELAGLEAGWAALLEEVPDVAAARERGTRLFQLGARLLGVESNDEAIGTAGRLFAEVNAGRLGFIEIGPGTPEFGPNRVARRVRPLTALAALAARDLKKGGPPFEPEATPGRAFTVIRHRLFGIIS
jgi:15-cis-phytoene synthase